MQQLNFPRRGYILCITLRNTKGIDIVASNEEGSKTINIQVKTSSKNTMGWILNKKAESVVDKNMFCVFVKLNKVNERPDFHIVPASKVAKTTLKKRAIRNPCFPRAEGENEKR